MLLGSQPLDAKTSKLLKSDAENYPRKHIVTRRYVGDMFGEFSDRKRKFCLRDHLKWKWERVKDVYRNIKWVIRNHIKWDRTMFRLRSWAGFDGMLSVMMAHLRDYIRMEEKDGHSVKEWRERKIATAKETVQLLKRMRDPDGYWMRLTDAVKKRYPDYKNLVEEYEDGGGSFHGDYVAQGNGWVGSGGYFEFVGMDFKRAVSPNRRETKRLMAELKQYHKDIENAYKQALIDSDKDFARLHHLLKENLYSWWD